MIARPPAGAPEAARNSFTSVGGPVRKKRQEESAEHRSERLEREARERTVRASADDKALDAAVRESIKLYGP
jgi:hypothetical protein